MSDKLKAKNLKAAIQRLPDPKSYGADVVTVAVDKNSYTFEKTNKEWYFKF
ncbi:hypothetical protein [Flavobacterium johnsoniae]|uniref:Uncharacterized protein n=1 Tax=Flavobacterium johnsoniae TaxID=986 RepID=A0A1M5IHX1_FLAJO|nr:hypothetical protein [Flavobacterium johnsoniae]SHG27902.1 hypothetical protein SAMN05444388_102110 [Flavobacterium johnsoniae]